MAKIQITAHYFPSVHEINTYDDIELPDGYTLDDIKQVDIRWCDEIHIEFKDGIEIILNESATTISRNDTVESDDYKWANHVEISNAI